MERRAQGRGGLLRPKDAPGDPSDSRDPEASSANEDSLSSLPFEVSEPQSAAALMQQNDALVSLNGRLVAMGMRARKRRVGVQPLPREIVRRRAPGLRHALAADNREDGRGNVRRRRGGSRAQLLVEPAPPLWAPRPARAPSPSPVSSSRNLGENPLCSPPGQARGRRNPSLRRSRRRPWPSQGRRRRRRSPRCPRNRPLSSRSPS